MESLDNLKRIRKTEVEGGKIILDVPQLSSGDEVEVKIVSVDRDTNQKDNTPTGDTPGDTSSFEDLHLVDELLEAVSDTGYTSPTPIQADAIPMVLEGKDVLATAQTGSGKTAAFVLPMLQQLITTRNRKEREPRALILTPTRELAIQVADSVAEYGKYLNLYHVMIYGGVSQRPQVKLLRKGIDVIIATPGRLLDLVNQGHVKLENMEIFVLDEADRMLDMGFMPDIKKVVRDMPNNRQNLLFSATMPKAIAKLAKHVQKNPVRISVDPPSSTVETINSYVYHVKKTHKFELLEHLFDTRPEMKKVLIFRRTKYNCEKLVRKLKKKGFYADRIHGDRSQNQRERVLEAFRNNKIDVLVGTDVAARGLDVDDITHVINYEISNEPEVYVHRVGRTARAGKSGVALNFCSKSEEKYVRDIEKLTQEKMIIADDFPYQSKGRANQKRKKNNRSSGKKNRRRKKYTSNNRH